MINEERVYQEINRRTDNLNETERHDGEGERSSKLWDLFGATLPQSEIVFMCQMVLLYVVTITALINLSRGVEPSNLWVALLSSCLGYVLPSPTLSTK